MYRNFLRTIALLIAAIFFVSLAEALSYQTANQLSQARKYYGRAQEYLAKGERDRGVEELKAAIKLAPQLVEAHHEYLQNQKGKAGALVEQYKAYASQHPASALYHYLLGRAYSNAGNKPQAESEFQKAMQIDPEFSWALVELGAQALDKQDKAKAIELFEKARKRAGNSAALHLELATRLESVDRYVSAAAEADRALRLDPKLFSAYRIRWDSRMRITSGSDRTLAEIEREAKRLESAHPRDAKALDAAREGYGLLFDEEKAARVRKAVLALDPKFYERRGGVRIFTTTPSGGQLEFSGPQAESYMRAGRIIEHEARVAAFQELERQIDDPEIKLNFILPSLAQAYLQAGDLENGERLVAQLDKEGLGFKLDPMWLDLTRIYVERKIKLHLAEIYLSKTVATYRKRIERFEKDERMRDSLTRARQSLSQALHLQGQLLIAQEKTEQAEPVLAESVKLAEQEGNTLDLGLLYGKLDKKDDAVGWLAAAYSFEGNRKLKARSALDQIYGEREKMKPLTALLAEAVEKRKVRAREEELAKRARAEGGDFANKPAPAFELAELSGQKVKLANYQGKVVLLNFWATW
jgi:tetratricopeptide (TPR) repeat protein